MVTAEESPGSHRSRKVRAWLVGVVYRLALVYETEPSVSTITAEVPSPMLKKM